MTERSVAGSEGVNVRLVAAHSRQRTGDPALTDHPLRKGLCGLYRWFDRRDAHVRIKESLVARRLTSIVRGDVRP